MDFKPIADIPINHHYEKKHTQVFRHCNGLFDRIH